MKITVLDSAPYTLIQRANIFGAANPITGEEFLNLSTVQHVDGAGTPDGTRLQVDPTIKRESLVALAQQSTWATIVDQDTIDGRFQPRDLSIADRKALYEASQE
jgi:hypothetical protein